MAYDQLGQSKIILEAGKNYLIKSGNDIKEIKILQVAGAYVLGQYINYGEDDSTPKWGEGSTLRVLEVVPPVPKKLN